MSDTPNLMTHERIMTGEEYVSYSDYLLLQRERNEARNKYDTLATEHMLVVNKLCKERDEAREHLREIKEYGTKEINAAVELRQKLASALVERDEAQKELSSIYRWIERNHADGFIDSLTYLQNLERVTDNWYDRLDRLEVDAKRFVRERDEARHKLELCMAANSDVARIAKERDEAREQIKELIYIAERAIALADIDFENDKFGVVSELRGDLEKIKKSK